jgi:hypothetical protein
MHHGHIVNSLRNEDHEGPSCHLPPQIKIVRSHSLSLRKELPGAVQMELRIVVTLYSALP